MGQAEDKFIGQGISRSFAVTVDLRLIPTTKVKPDTGSPFHGVELGKSVSLPFAWVIVSDAQSYRLIKDRDEARARDPLGERA